MNKARTLFESLSYCGDGQITLNVGAPGPSTLRKCAQLMLTATKERLDEEMASDAPLLQYGTPRGDPAFIEQLAAFLTAEYHDTVDQSQLVTTAGATNGLHVLLTLLFPHRCPIFVEELTYFLALRMFSDDLKFPLYPVIMGKDGVDIDDLQRQIDQAKISNAKKFPQYEHGYWAVLYTIPVYHNPTGRCLSAEKSVQLVELARKNGILVLAEDVYNLLYYQCDKPPKRLFAYDQEKRASLGDKTGGCVVSNGTFSKLLTPGLRLGWLELPTWIMKIWENSGTLHSGGCLNTYTSGLVSKAMKMGLVSAFVKELRIEYKKRRDVMVEKLKGGLPEQCQIEVPHGGYFVWIELPRNMKASDVQRMALEKHNILFQDGTRFCVPDRAAFYQNYIRLAISYHEANVLADATEKLTMAIRECASMKF